MNAVDVVWHRPEPFRLIQNNGTGLLSYGCRSWQSYRVSADVTPHLVQRAGLVAGYQGLMRYYALVLNAKQQRLQLVCEHYNTRVLAEVPMAVEFGRTYELQLYFAAGQLTGCCGNHRVVAPDDTYASGGIALLVDEGRTATVQVNISPLSPEFR